MLPELRCCNYVRLEVVEWSGVEWSELNMGPVVVWGVGGREGGKAGLLSVLRTPRPAPQSRLNQDHERNKPEEVRRGDLGVFSPYLCFQDVSVLSSQPSAVLCTASELSGGLRTALVVSYHGQQAGQHS